MFYPKIDTLYVRGSDFKVTNVYRRPEFSYINEWLWTEKLDGSNISIASTRFGTVWRGRTNRSQFTSEMQDHLQMLCERWHNTLQKKLEQYKLDGIEIFGEIIGPKIQNGGIYTDTLATRFYDVRVNNSVWLDWDAVHEYSKELGFTKPAWGVMNRNSLVEMVKEGFSTYEGKRDGTAEGVVAKTRIPLYNNNNQRVIWKLKTKDFE